MPSTAPTPEEVIDRHALRDWLWAGLETLTEPLQVTILLRYFTGAASYEQIAAVCGVPIGTVRSRLAQARRKLADALRHSADAAHPDVDLLTARRRRDVEALVTAGPTGEFRSRLAALAAPDVVLHTPQGHRLHGWSTLVHIMDSDTEAGVRQRLLQVTAGRRVTIVECDLLSPPWDPHHCPPAVLWLMTVNHERIERIQLFHPATAVP